MITDRNTGGPAFPLPGVFGQPQFNGMTLRDYFAAKAMQAEYQAVSARGGCELYSDIAERAYILADAMLRARALESE